MLSIRLRRTGKKHQPSFRLIVIDKRKDPWGDYLENLGHYNPRTKEAILEAARIQHWISKGAEVTPTVWNILVDKKVVEGKKRAATEHRFAKKSGETPAAPAPTAA